MNETELQRLGQWISHRLSSAYLGKWISHKNSIGEEDLRMAQKSSRAS
jgi:hypothetical protein